MLLVLGIVIAAMTQFFDACTQEAVSLQDGVEIVTTCAAATVSDPRYVFPVLLALLLISPELSEFTIGAISIKRRLDRTQRDQQDLKGQVEGLRQQIQLQSNQQVIVQVPTYVNPRDPELTAPLRAAGVEMEEAPRGAPQLSTAEIQVELLKVFERLRVFDRRLTRFPEAFTVLRPERGEALEASASEIARTWPEASGLGVAALAEQAHVFTHNFQDTLDAIRAVRNAIAHGKQIDDDDLRRTYGFAFSLERWLSNQLSRHHAHLREFESEGPQDVGPRVPPSE